MTQPLEYTVTSADTFSYTAPAFAAVPADCTFTYSSLVDSEPDPAFTVATHTWTWNDLNSMSNTSVNSPYYVDRTITITATSHDSTLTATTTTALRIKNPCVDATFNLITSPEDKTITYTINDELVVIDYTEGFSVGLEALCGGITFTLTGLTTEVTQATDKLEVKTLDRSKIGETQIITVKPALTNYPDVVSIPDLKITVQFVECFVTEVKLPVIASTLSYKIGTAATALPFAAFDSEEARNCKLTPWTYTAKLESAAIGGEAMSSYITLNADTSEF